MPKTTQTQQTTTAESERIKLNTAIEREVHRLVKTISESAYDRLQLQVRKEGLPVEPAILTHILKTMQLVISDIERTNIDKLHESLRPTLDAALTNRDSSLFTGTTEIPLGQSGFGGTITEVAASKKQNFTIG